MLRKNKNYIVDEVINALSKKGCVITTMFPITKSVKDIIVPNDTLITERYGEYVLKNQRTISLSVNLLGIEAANFVAFNAFKEKNPQLFAVKEIRRTVVVQPEYTVNVSGAHELGNKSWGKIDFLRNYQGFKLMK